MNTTIIDQYNILNTFIATKSDRYFSVLVNTFSTSIKNLIKSAVKNKCFSVDSNDIYNKVLLILWKKLPLFKLPKDPAKAVNSFYKYTKLIAINCVKAHGNKLLINKERYISLDEKENQNIDLPYTDAPTSNFEIINVISKNLSTDLQEDFNMLVDFKVRKMPLAEVCSKYNLTKRQIYTKTFNIRKTIRKEKFRHCA